MGTCSGDLREAALWPQPSLMDGSLQLQTSKGRLQAAAPGPLLSPQAQEGSTKQGCTGGPGIQLKEPAQCCGGALYLNHQVSCVRPSLLIPPPSPLSPSSCLCTFQAGPTALGSEPWRSGGHFLGHDGRDVAIHKGDKAHRACAALRWWSQREPKVTLAPIGPGPDSGSVGVVSPCIEPGDSQKLLRPPPQALGKGRRLAATSTIGRTTIC